MIVDSRVIQGRNEVRGKKDGAPVLAQLHNRSDQDAVVVRNFIRTQFARKYNASIVSFLPYLISVYGKDGIIKSAVGYRAAGEEALYLEQYIPNSIEQVLSEKTHSVVRRESIVEVGNLACVCSGYARIVILQLTQMLYLAGFEWVVFTLTKELQNSFQKLGLSPQLITSADADSVNSEDDWGRYYETSPTAMFGHIQTGYQQLFGGENGGR